MEEIRPELISRMASRIYNEVPQATRLPAAETPLPELPTTPTPTAAPAELPASAGNVPHSFGSWPPIAGPAGLASPIAAGAGQGRVASRRWACLGSLIDRVPSFAPTTAPGSPDGLREFVASIRQSHYAGRNLNPNEAGRSFDNRSVSDAPPGRSGSRPLDVPAIREDFPILRQRVHGKPLAWLDNAATTQKPQSVIDAVSRFYEHDNSNIHRGAHTLAARATDAYEKAREKVQTFLGASSIKEIVFVRGTTEGINLITQTYGRKFLQPGDEIVMSVLEHHANIVPWQMVAKEKGAVIRVIPVNDRGEIMLEEYQKLLGPRTKVVALTQASNSLGTILPVAEMTQMAKRYGARVLIDGAQSVAHVPIDLQQLGCDFFVFSGHKIFAPTGIGAVYIKEELHDITPPWQGGGNMIRNVTFEETTFSEAPRKFEAGTPNIADTVGLGRRIGLRQPAGVAEYRRLRARIAAIRDRRAEQDRRIAADRHRAREGRCDFVCAAQSAHRRCRPAVGPRRYRGPRRPPLLATVATAIRCRIDGPAVAVVL